MGTDDVGVPGRLKYEHGNSSWWGFAETTDVDGTHRGVVIARQSFVN